MSVDFEKIYSTDLAYVPDCWKLCGDAYYCNFRRYKSIFRLIEKKPVHEIPLLPGEYEFLREKNWLGQFHDHDHRVMSYDFGDRTLHIDLIVSRRGGCACDHGTRTTVCRLYPLLPVFDEAGRLLATDRVGPYDIMEEIAGRDRACQVTSMPMRELEKFLAIAAEIARDPLALFYISAYRIAQDHLRERLLNRVGDNPTGVFRAFESGLLLGNLIDHEGLRQRLTLLAEGFDRVHGPAFSLALAPLQGLILASVPSAAGPTV